jgi:hypothetical protein
MMNYKLVQTGVADIRNTDGEYVTKVYDIIETATDQVVRSGIPAYMNKANNACHHLNMGGGFDGYTPSFFLAPFPRRAR